MLSGDIFRFRQGDTMNSNYLRWFMEVARQEYNSNGRELNKEIVVLEVN